MVRSIVVITLVAASAGLSAQNRASRNAGDDFGRSADAWCADADRSNRGNRVACDVRQETLAGVSSLDVDTGGNGGISVRGTDGTTPRLRYRVVTHGRSMADAENLAKQIAITTTDGRFRASGPRTGDGQGWSVDVEVETPPDLPLTLTTANGGISIERVSGRTRFETANGGVSLSDISGDVRGRTVNGGLTVTLDGQRWNGTGLDVETTNGGVRMTLPDGYNANLSAETTNGGLDIDFPVTVQGRLSAVNRRITTTLGSGGPPIHVRTVNGGVTIARR
jgi:hypothetical protein